MDGFAVPAIHERPADALLITADHGHPAPRRVAGQVSSRCLRALNRRTSHMGRGSDKTGIFVSFQVVGDLEGAFVVQLNRAIVIHWQGDAKKDLANADTPELTKPFCLRSCCFRNPSSSRERVS